MSDNGVVGVAGAVAPACRAGIRASADRERLRDIVKEVDRQAMQLGILPPMNRFRGILRHAARLAGRIFLYLGRVITNPQGRINAAVAKALQEVLTKYEQLETAHEVLRDKVAYLEKILPEQGRQVRELAQRLSAGAVQPGVASPPTTFPAPGSSPAYAGGSPGDFDALYVLFEDRFRGTREEIMRRQQRYLSLLCDSGIGGEDMPVLDLGCGRGEWLELLGGAGTHARGVDCNRFFLEDCRQRGLTVVADDVLHYLHSLPDESVGAVTGFHIIEHLPFPVFLQFLDESVRVLKPGGLALFETPNPENMFVGSCTFWADPTHQHPLFPPSVQFLCEQRGLHDVEILRGPAQLDADAALQPLPADHPLAAPVNQLVHLAQRHFQPPMDYAVVGRKPPRDILQQRAA
jgi:SAM-dependent methyltransferase